MAAVRLGTPGSFKAWYLQKNISLVFLQRLTLCQQYLQCIVPTMIVLAITRTIVIVSLWFSIRGVHTKGPQLNTLFVDIGQLYPRADFAGVLIDLNVDQAIARGKAAINLTDYFLRHSYNKPKQKIGKWTGANRNIHFRGSLPIQGPLEGSEAIFWPKNDRF